MNDELWKIWSDCHNNSDQQKRFESGKKSSCTPTFVDFTKLSGTFKGSSGTHSTTLQTCSCIDFNRRRLPCKHMYRLAMELGCIDTDFYSNINDVALPKQKQTGLKKQTISRVFSALTEENELRIFKDFCYSVGNKGGDALLPTSIANKLMKYDIVVPVTDVRKLLPHVKMPALRKFLSPGTKCPRTKKELVEILVPIVSPESIQFDKDVICVTLHPQISDLGLTLHRNICAVLPKEEPNYPYWN